MDVLHSDSGTIFESQPPTVSGFLDGVTYRPHVESDTTSSRHEDLCVADVGGLARRRRLRLERVSAGGQIWNEIENDETGPCHAGNEPQSSTHATCSSASRYRQKRRASG
jgi:hypothetical protein